jgi:hypothetical protein
VFVKELLLLTLAAAVCDTLEVGVSEPLAETEELAETVPVSLEVGEDVPLPVALAEADAVTDPVLDCVASALRLTLAEAPIVGLPDRDEVDEPVPVAVLEALRLPEAELEPDALLLRLAEALPVPVSVAVAEGVPVSVLVLLMLAAAVPVMLGVALSEALAVSEFVAEAVPVTVLVAAQRRGGGRSDTMGELWRSRDCGLRQAVASASACIASAFSGDRPGKESLAPSPAVRAQRGHRSMSDNLCIGRRATDLMGCRIAFRCWRRTGPRCGSRSQWRSDSPMRWCWHSSCPSQWQCSSATRRLQQERGSHEASTAAVTAPVGIATRRQRNEQRESVAGLRELEPRLTTQR